MRDGRPMLQGRTWKLHRDPLRSVTKIAFATDYVKAYTKATADGWKKMPSSNSAKLMELERYDEFGMCMTYIMGFVAFDVEGFRCSGVPSCLVDMSVFERYLIN